jgi:cell division protein FtsB
MRYWGTENNVSRSGKSASRSRRPRSHRTERRSRPDERSGGGSGARHSIAGGGSVKNYPFLRQFYRHQTQISARLQRVLFFLVLAALIYVFFLGDSGLIKITQLRLERSRLDRSIAELEHTNQQLEATITRLENDNFYIEKVGRERYGYVRPGDRVYKFIPIDRRDY